MEKTMTAFLEVCNCNVSLIILICGVVVYFATGIATAVGYLIDLQNSLPITKMHQYQNDINTNVAWYVLFGGCIGTIQAIVWCAKTLLAVMLWLVSFIPRLIANRIVLIKTRHDPDIVRRKENTIHANDDTTTHS